MPIPQTPVRSALIRSAGHDAETSTLALTHHDGSVYHYADVPAHKFQRLLTAPSIGAYIHQNIRGFHPHTQQ